MRKHIFRWKLPSKRNLHALMIWKLRSSHLVLLNYQVAVQQASNLTISDAVESDRLAISVNEINRNYFG